MPSSQSTHQSVHQSTELSGTIFSGHNNIGSLPLHGSVNSLIVSDKLSTSVYDRLAKQFQLTQYTPNMDMKNFDAVFIDCRGTKINCSFEKLTDWPNITVALVDEYSYLPHDLTNCQYSGEPTTLELTTDAELGSAVLKLRLDACKRVKIKPANTDYSATSFVKNNAFQLLQTFVQNSTDWIVVKDLDHRFMMASDRFLKSQNKSAEDIIGKNDLEIGISPELVLGNAEKKWEGFWELDKQVIASGKPSYTEQNVVHEHALQKLREQIAKIPITDAAGNTIGLMIIITQVHSSKFNGRTVSEFTSRCSTTRSPIIDTSYDEKREGVLVREQLPSLFNKTNNFIATASHDLRQPLQAIGLFIESLEHQIKDENQQTTLKKMKKSSNDLTELLNSILYISKLDADAIIASNTHFCIAPLLKSLEDEFETQAMRKSLRLHFSNTNSFIFSDSLLLAQILRNLVSNSVKYTQTGYVHLTTEVNNNSLLIQIKDSGPGIPKEQYLAIFDEYNQPEDSISQPNFGMGLGLSIVKRLTDLLDLDISLESKTTNGTRITLTVPLGVETDTLENSKKGNHSKKPVGSYKLLLVEDNPIVLDATHEMLTCMNCDAYPASDIEEALEIINELDELPDLLIVDYQLANGVTGDTAIEKIRDAANKKLPAIIVTGNTNSNVFREASKAAYRVLNKPVNPDILLKTIESAVEHHRESLI